MHLTYNDQALPALLQVETAAVAETTVLDQKEAIILNVLRPATLAADNSYTQAMRLRRWPKQGVVLLTPAI